MTTDRAPTLALAAAVVVTAVVFGPAVPAVDLPRDGAAAEPVFDGFAETGELGVSERFSYSVGATPATASVANGVVSTGPATVTVAAGDDPVALRYRLVVGDRSANRTVVVPAGETRTVTESLTLDAGQRPDSATLRIAAVVDGTDYSLHTDRIEVAADG